MNKKKENLCKIANKIDQENEKQKLNEIYNHLHRLQNRMDEITSQIYLMHEQCIENPSNIIVKDKIESKYNGDDQDDDDDDIEQYKSLEIMRDIMLGLNRTFNEWKFIVSKINPNSKLLEKYKDIGFEHQGLVYSNKYRYHQEMETVIEDDNYIDDDDEKLISVKSEQKSIMSGLFAKLNKQRAKMSITQDGEELYEPTEEAKHTLRARMKKQEEKEDDLLNVSMVKAGNGICAMDKYNMMDELKNVLKTRKQAAINKFQEKRRAQIGQSANDKDEMKYNNNDNYNPLSRMEAMKNIRGSYPSEEIIENYYSDRSSDDQVNEEETLSQEQEKRFLMELNRLGLGNGAFMTSTNTQISSFGYDREKDKNTMSLFAVLQNQNKREMKSVLNGNADDVEVEFELNGDDNDREYQSELQKTFSEARSDDEGATMADELAALMQ